MIKFSVCYPWQEDARFDFDYYQQKHIPLVREKMAEHGLEKLEVVLGKNGFTGNSPAYIAIANLYFASETDMKMSLKAAGKALAEDLSNYTDIVPIQEIAQVVISDL